MKALIATLWLVSLYAAANASSIELDPKKGQTLASFAEHPIKGVTEIHLLSGDHGKPTLMGLSGLSIYGDGKTTVVGRTYVVGCRDLLFRYVKFRGLQDPIPNWKNALFFSDGASQHIHVSDSSFAATDDTSKWSDADWLKLPFGQLVYSNAQGATFTNNEFFNTYSVMSINGDDWLVAHNSMHDFVNDGIDFRGSNVSIDGNKIFDSHDLPSNPMHADGIQGMAAVHANDPVNANVRIRDNHIDAGTKTNSPMQGLSAFDGRWKNVTITGNYVRPRAYHGISWSGVDGIVIDQNIVDQYRQPGGAPIVSYPQLPPPWICVNSAKNKTPSTNVHIGENVTPRYAGNTLAAMRPRPVPVRSLAQRQ